MTTSNETSNTSNEFKNLDDIQSVLANWVTLEETKQQATKCWFDNLKAFYMLNTFENMSDCIDKALYHSGYATSETATLRTDAPKKVTDRNSTHYDIQDGFEFINPNKALGKSGVEVMNSTIRSVSTGKKGKLEPKNITQFATYKELKDYYYSVQSKTNTKANDKDGAKDKDTDKGSSKASPKDSDSAPTIEQCIAFIALQYPSVGRIAKLAVEVNGSKNAEDLNKILNSIQIETPTPTAPTTPKDITPEPVAIEDDSETFELDTMHKKIIKGLDSDYGIDTMALVSLTALLELVELTIDDKKGYETFSELLLEMVNA
jgi:hypothetical protein